MNLPQLTKIIGEQLEISSQNENSCLYNLIDDGILKTLKNDEQGLVVNLVFDFDSDKIFFELSPERLSEEFLENNFYFGNNSGAGFQYYLARNNDSLHFLFEQVFRNLEIKLNEFHMLNSDLGRLIQLMYTNNFLSKGISKNELDINIEKFYISNLIFDGKGLKIDGKNISYEELVRKQIYETNKKNKILIILPAIKEKNKLEILSQANDYLTLVKLEKKFIEIDSLGLRKKDYPERICYICHKKKPDVKIEEYSTNFKRSRINKVFTTTTKNTSYYSIEYGKYLDNYSFCRNCYINLFTGEKSIAKKLKIQIAGERVFIIPEGITDNFSFEYTNFKKYIDLAFKNTADEWLKEIEGSSFFDGILSYSINFIFFKTDGNSFSVLETIEDVSPFLFKKIIDLFKNHSDRLSMKYAMSLGSIYHMIPVKIKIDPRSKKEIQIDIGRVLSFYKSFLSREIIDIEIIFSYALEALEKGINQINKKDQNNNSFKNLGWKKYLNKNEFYKDFYIKNLIDNFLVLINSCKDLSILTFSSSMRRKISMEPLITFSDQVNESIKGMEEFLVIQNYPDEAKSLFFLGTLINRVAVAQMNKEHRTKPILRKIQFQGMSIAEINRLYDDVVEKLRQYNKITIFTEGLMNRFHAYHGSYEGQWDLSESANVFYLISGYAFMVGRKAPDLSKKEQDILQEDLSNIEEDQNESNNEEEN